MEIHDERVKTKRAAPFIYSDLPLITHALFLFLSFSSHLALPLGGCRRRQVVSGAVKTAGCGLWAVWRWRIMACVCAVEVAVVVLVAMVDDRHRRRLWLSAAIRGLVSRALCALYFGCW
jgi:hypothetical protein